MTTRRNFIKSTGIGIAGLAASRYDNLFAIPFQFSPPDYKSLRPEISKRNF